MASERDTTASRRHRDKRWLPEPGMIVRYAGRYARMLTHGRTVRVLAEAVGERMVVEAIGQKGGLVRFTVMTKHLAPLGPDLFGR